MRHRIREVAAVDYQVVRRNTEWADHVARTLATAGFITWLEPNSLLDPACGDASLALAAHRLRPIDRVYLADVSEPSIAVLDDHLIDLGIDGWEAFVGDAGEILDEAAQHGARYDVVVLTEFLEHVDNPDWILEAARKVATFVVASSPLINSPHDDDGNPEHLWAFDNQGYADMLTGAGWTPMVRNNLMFRDFQYAYQIWVARA